MRYKNQQIVFANHSLRELMSIYDEEAKNPKTAAFRVENNIPLKAKYMEVEIVVKLTQVMINFE